MQADNPSQSSLAHDAAADVHDVNTLPGAVAPPPAPQMVPVLPQLPTGAAGVPSPMGYPYAAASGAMPHMSMNTMAAMSMHHTQLQMMAQPAHHAGMQAQQQQQMQPPLSMSNRACQKKTRLVWTPELHKRFLFAVERIGLKVAVPRTILQVCPSM